MIFLLSGPIHSGKTSLIKVIIKELQSVNIKLDGFISNPIFKNKEIIGYDLFDLKKEKPLPFIVKFGENSWQKIGSFFFIPEGLKEANKIILRGKDADILIIDEIGPLELSGQGVWPSLKKVISPPVTRLLLVVRENIIENFRKLLGNGRMKIFNIENKEVAGHIIEDIITNLKSRDI